MSSSLLVPIQRNWHSYLRFMSNHNNLGLMHKQKAYKQYSSMWILFNKHIVLSKHCCNNFENIDSFNPHGNPMN